LAHCVFVDGYQQFVKLALLGADDMFESLEPKAGKDDVRTIAGERGGGCTEQRAWAAQILRRRRRKAVWACKAKAAKS
jgi:hypothetical protein